ncbi:MAG: hypothetical protein HW407_2293, partial [Bacteroidetes bacterium]|nr:hypothetical protein [Bacteroidota bacterium]
KKNSGRPRLPYNVAVEEALCYGWIDSILKPIDERKYAQRFTPRKPRSNWSAMNIERLHRLIQSKRMRRAGLKAAASVLESRPGRVTKSHSASPKVPADILRKLKKDRAIWENFSCFPQSYKRIRIGWIEGARKRPDVFDQRLRYFLKMTKQNKRFGMVQ